MTFWMIIHNKEGSMKQRALNFVSIIAMTMFLFIIASMPLEAASLNLGEVEINPGGKATIPLTLSQGYGIVAVSADISYDTSVLKNPKAEIGDAAQSGEKQIHSSIPEQGVFRVSILGMNLDEIPDGTVATITFDVAPSAPIKKKVQLTVSPSASDAMGNTVPVSSENGVIRIK